MIFFLAWIVPLGLFFSLPSCMWNFDGVACAAALELGNPVYFFHSQHLLYGFFGFLFWKGIAVLSPGLRALSALQVFTSLLAAGGLAGLYKALVTQTEDSQMALWITWSMAVSAVFWVWSVEVQVYALGFLGLAWATYFLLRYDDAHFRRWVGVFHGLAILGHAMNALWLVPLWVYLRRNPQPGTEPVSAHWRSYLSTLLPVVILPYVGVVAMVHHLIGTPATLVWLKGSVGLTPDRSWAWHSAGWDAPWQWLRASPSVLWGSFWPYQSSVSIWSWLMTGISMAVAGVLIFRSWRKRDNPVWAFALAWIGTYAVLLWTWEPTTLCYRMTDILPIALLASLGVRSLPKRTFVTASLCVWTLSTAVVTLTTRIRPMQESALNSVYTEITSIARATPENSVYLTSSMMEWIYLLYFTGRPAWLETRPPRQWPAGSPVYRKTPQGWALLP